MTDAQAFGLRLQQLRRAKQFRDDRDISWEEVAAAVGLSGAAISRYVKGRVIPDDAIMQKLADYFGVTRAFIRYGVESGAQPKLRVAEPPPIATGFKATSSKDLAAAAKKAKRRRA